MRHRRTLFATLLGFALSGVVAPRPTSAWLADGTPIGLDCSGLIEYPNALPDGAGGAYLFWRDGRDRVNRLDVSGNLAPGWTSCGPTISTEPSGQHLQYQHAECPDGAGGIFVLFCMVVGCPAHCTGEPRDLYLQRVTAYGAIAPGWPSNGVVISANGHDHLDPTIAPDGAGGALMAWTDASPAPTRVFAQRVAGDGSTLWNPGGVAVGVGTWPQRHPAILPAPGGGATVIWEDERIAPGSTDLYVRRASPQGVLNGPTVVGTPLCTENGAHSLPVALSDGAGGGLVIWKDTGGGDVRFLGQRLDGAATAQWGLAGVALSGPSVDTVTPRPCPDGAGGFFLSWADVRNAGTTGSDVYVAHVMDDGAPASGWPADGLPICTAIGAQSGAAVASDGLGGVFAIWSDARSGGPRLYGTHRHGNGGLASGWPAQGTLLCGVASDQSPVALVPSLPGSVIAMWVDERQPGRGGTYATRLVGDGPVPVLASLVRATRTAGSIELVWQLGACPATTWLERNSGSGWTAVASPSPDGMCRVSWVDHSISTDARYGYRLSWNDDEGPHRSAEVWLDASRACALALAGARFVANGAGLEADCVLPRADAAHLTLVDVAGRRRASALAGGTTGQSTVTLTLPGGLAAGVYLLMLEQGDLRVSRPVTRLP